jgi:hypothetical protein
MLHLQTIDSPVLSGICRVPLDRTKMKTGHCTCFLYMYLVARKHIILQVKPEHDKRN